LKLVVWHETAGWLGGAEGKSGQDITTEAGKEKDVGALS